MKLALLQWALARLDRQEVVEFLIASKLWLCRIHQIVHRRYAQKYGGFEGAAAQVANEDGNDTNANTNANASANQSDEWDWRGLPRIPLGIARFEYFMNYYYGFVLLKSAAPNYLHALIGLFRPPMGPHCYLLGHLVAHELLEPQVAILFAIYQLMWRLLTHLSQRHYVFSLYVFLSMTERDLERFCGLLEKQCNSRESKQAGGGGSSISSSSNTTTKRLELPGQYLQSRRLSGATNALSRDNFEQRLSISIPIDLHQEAALAARECRMQTSGRVERLFKSALCYRIERNATVCYKLKPNRTPQARLILRRHLLLISLIVTCAFILCVIGFQSYVQTQVFSLERYLKLYPACGHELNSTLSGEQLGRTPRPFTWHYMLSTAYESVENLVIWVDVGYSLAFCWTAAYLLNYDIEFYSKCLNEKLTRAHAQVIWRHQIRQAAGLEPRSKPIALARLDDWAQKHDECSKHELLAQFYNFFAHIQEIDLLISDVVTFTIGIWVSLFVVLGESAIVRARESDDPVFIKLVIFLESFTYIVVTVGCFSLLTLHGHCQRSYSTVCSMMAFDTSTHKESLTHLIEFYTAPRRASYTIFQQYPFTRTTYLSIMGWSFSCFFILDGIFRR